ncbi:MAG: NAD(P)/FAD-dependent oxidoreductase [Acidimicrobiia bacterium]|nr:NAD(P)/FAD-dependent oxidoreductase [Acidimicrobiia bacterium]
MRSAVLGAGVTGLVIARELAKRGDEVVVYEAAPSVAGLVMSHEIAGTPLEAFYHHIFTHERHIRDLIDELGLHDRLEWLPSSVGIFHTDADGTGRVWPFTNPRDLLTFAPVKLRDRIRMGAASVLAPYLSDWRKLDDVPAGEWITKTMGRSAYEEIWEPMLRVKWSEVHDRLPAAWVWARLAQRAKSRDTRDMGEKLGYMRGGFKQLYDALAADLHARGVKVEVATPVRRILTRAGVVAGVETDSGAESFDRVVSTLPVPVFSSLLDALPPDYKARLDAFEYMWVVCVILTLDRGIQPIYWLNVADRTIPFGAFIEHTNLLPVSDYGGNHVVYLGRYFPPPSYSAEAAALATGDLHDIAGEWIRHIARINPEFDPSWVTSVAPFRTQYAAPLVQLGQGKRRLPFATPVDGLWLATMAQIYPDDRGQSEGVRLGLDCVRTMAASARGR